MVYYLSDEMNFKISNKIGLGEIEGFLIVTRTTYYQAIRDRFALKAIEKKNRYLLPLKISGSKLYRSTLRFKERMASAVTAFKG